MLSKDAVTYMATENCLQGIVNACKQMTTNDVVSEVLDEIKQEYDLQNAIKQEKEKWVSPCKLEPAQVAQCILALHNVAMVSSYQDAEREYDQLCIYHSDGDKAGLYVEDDDDIQNLIHSYNHDLKPAQVADVMNRLRAGAKRISRCSDMDLIAVNNGIFDYKKKELLDFSPDYVFTSKSRVNYNPSSSNVVIHNDDGTDWDIESWMLELTDDEELTELLWQIIGAIIRPNVAWNKAAWFYSNTGNNGKGTLCELMRQIVGAGSYASITLSDMSKDFMLSPLTRAQAIIVDENDVGTYIDKAANLKAIITGDVIQINRKFKNPIAYKFRGFMVQCLNEYPKIKDKSDSFFRRQIFVPFSKCFTGRERKYIKEEYLHRTDVLEYALHRVLHTDYYEFSIPRVCVDALNEYKEYNDPTIQFVNDILPQLQWDFVPITFLYDVYKAWYKHNVSSTGDGVSKENLFKSIDNLVCSGYVDGWKTFDKVLRPYQKMDLPEPLIEEYDLKEWMNKYYRASDDVDKKCRTTVKSSYRGGLLRIV